MKLRNPAFERAIIAGCEEELKKTPALWVDYRRRQFWERLVLTAEVSESPVAIAIAVALVVPGIVVWLEYALGIRGVRTGQAMTGTAWLYRDVLMLGCRHGPRGQADPFARPP